jgi:hypothetical protein
MPTIVLQFPRDDTEFRQALETQFGEKVTVAEVKSFDGIDCLQAIVTIVLPLAPSISEFLIAYLRERKKRIILSRDGEVRLENYSVAGAKELLDQILNKPE